MSLRNKILILLSIFSCFIFFNFNVSAINVKADALSDSIQEQLANLNLDELEQFFNDNAVVKDIDFFSCVTALLKGEYKVEYSSIFDYIKNVVFTGLFDFVPIFLSIIVIAILYSIIKSASPSTCSDGVCQVTLFVCLLGVILLLSSQIITMYENIKNTIKNIAKLTEIMSPILITLMVAVGGKTSASIYTPTVSFLANGVVNLFLSVVLPLVATTTFLSVSSCFLGTINLGKFTDFFSGIIKWIFGITVSIFTIFLSIQGIASAHFDCISIKAAKYALSNSIPIVGGFIKDGFDLVVAGSVLIKNTIGISSIALLFFIILSPVLNMGVFSLLLKFTAGITEVITDSKISYVCTTLSKTIAYLTATLLVVGLMVFIMILLMIFSANAFI